ncbi:MAG: response regulator [Bacteroidota bacterium]|nr:response regulator [Candidatus Kapabacteria bacterium]MCS7302165.1 response regulator [Candidatus Kapabacteria bacterium]MCX7936406.1 response regulator [Chlorobiota bacterium]MDW8074314.1 response regulator [Bacteroidota bacterium]MDW8271210.1 response regulator [Bacteroidota bacterium]
MSSTGEHTTTLHILCIEDHPLDRELISRQLQRDDIWGELRFALSFAGTLGEAVMLAQTTTVDVCLADLVLPDSRGIETVHVLRRVLPTAAIVVITADTDPLTLRQAVYANVQGYLVKGEYASGALARTIIAAWERARLEQRLAETSDKLRRLQEQYRALLEFLPDGVIMTDSHARILYLNPAAQELLGRSSGELLGEELVGLPSSIEQPIEVVIAHRAGKLRSALVHCQHAAVDGQAVVFYFLRDITEQRTYEQQRRHRERIELLGMLASGVAHDINNLLSPIMLGVQTLLRGANDDRQRRVLTMIEESARRGAELIRQVLSYARAQDTQRQLIAPYDVIAEEEPYWHSLLPASITLDVRGVDRLAPAFYGDRLQVKQALTHLVTNAKEAIGNAPGTIRIAAYATSRNDPRLASKGIADDSFVVFDVSDTGCGIPEDLRHRIFEPFFTTKSGASGLGLYTVLTIVKRHHGVIHVDSRVGEGTTVSIFFPLVEDSTEHRGVVLLLIPSATMRQLVRSTLEAEGFRILEASSPAEVLSVFVAASSSVEIVIADDDPSVPGCLEKLGAIRQLKPSVRIVLLCSLLAQGALRQLEGNVVDRFIAKPFTDQMLLDAVAGLNCAPGG